MRAGTASILVYDRTELPGDRRRFAAALCFMLFFTNFVLGGTRFFPREDLRPLGLRHLGEIEFWQAVTQLCVATTAYLAGRSLWYGRRWARWWLAGAIIAILVHTGTDLYCTFEWMRPKAWARGWQALYWIDSEALALTPFAFSLIAAVWLSRWRLPVLSSRYPGWLILALAWAVGCVFASMHFNIGWVASEVFGTWWPNVGNAVQPIVLSRLPFLPVVLLVLLRSRRLRIAAIILATVEITAFVVWTRFGIAHLVGISIEGLFISVPKCHSSLPSPFPFGICYFNRDTLRFVVDLMTQAGPWVLIAIYARKYPMRVPVDDGSPWPRAYCGHCGYNLQGIESHVCPECGRQLIG